MAYRRDRTPVYCRDIKADGAMTVLLKDDTICIRCGLCATRCPTEAMTMERFNFIESTE